MSEGRHFHWGAEALWEQLEPLLPGISVEVVARVESTNTRLLDRARQLSGQRDAPVTRPGQLEVQVERRDRGPYGRRAGDTQPCLLVAEQQTRGRGRLGKDWVAAPGQSLTFSLALPLAPREWSGLSLAVGLALAQALEPAPAGAPRLQLKWPNDLWLAEGPGRGRKLGGVLIETVALGTSRMCVVGVGLNVQPLPAAATAELANGFACLAELEPEISAPEALARVAAPLVRALKAFELQGFAPLAAAYAQRDLLRGHAVTTTAPEAPAGIASGVDERGALLVRAGDAQHAVVSGEVSVRLSGDA